jgi:hypothetical protein
LRGFSSGLTPPPAPPLELAPVNGLPRENATGPEGFQSKSRHRLRAENPDFLTTTDDFSPQDTSPRWYAGDRALKRLFTRNQN